MPLKIEDLELESKVRLEDLELEKPEWLIENWFPLRHRILDIAPEGSYKTIWGCYLSVCIASGHDVFGRPVFQGPVVIIDEESPKESVEVLLRRFSEGMGLDYDRLPIFIESMKGFRFGRRSEIVPLLDYLQHCDPVFIRLDSLIAMLPSGVQSLGENQSKIGEIVRDNLNLMLEAAPNSSIMMSVHTKKMFSELSIDEIKTYQLQSIVRGHGSIVGEGCDTGLIVKKVSEHPNPSRFAIFTKKRRKPINIDATYIELEEESYGKGWARLKEIPENEFFLASDEAKLLYSVFKDGGMAVEYSSEKLRRTCALMTMRECRQGLRELFFRKVVVIGSKALTYTLNPKLYTQVNPKYLSSLDGSNP